MVNFLDKRRSKLGTLATKFASAIGCGIAVGLAIARAGAGL